MAKTNLMCKWVVKAMQPGKSNLQLMLRYRLARCNPQRGRKWGVSLDCFTNKQHQGFPGSKIWGHISRAWKIMVRGTYQLPPRSRMELLHSNIWWLEGVELLEKGIDMLEASTYTVKESGASMMFGIARNKNFSLGSEHKGSLSSQI